MNTDDNASDFMWCDVRWPSEGQSWQSPHICAENEPGHTEHRCCCGAVKK